MWQRFTERARRVVFFAQEEATRLGENYVSTEHLLLGLIRENDSVAARVLERVGVPLSSIRTEIDRQVAHGEGRQGKDMQLTPRAKRVIDLAYDEARTLSNSYIGTEHLLVGLIREGEGLAARVLSKLGVDLERVREEVTLIQQESKAQSEAKGEAETQEKIAPRYLDAEPQPQRGDLGVLRNPDGRERVEVAASAEALSELTKDHHAYRDLVSGDKITILPAETEVKLLRVDDPRGYFVRLLGGERDGQTSWVSRVQVQHRGPDTRPFPPPVDDVHENAEPQETSQPETPRRRRKTTQAGS